MRRLLALCLAGTIASSVSAQDTRLRWIPYPFPPDVTTSFTKQPKLERELSRRQPINDERSFSYEYEVNENLGIGQVTMGTDGSLCLGVTDERGNCSIVAQPDELQFRLQTYDSRMPIRFRFGLKK